MPNIKYIFLVLFGILVYFLLVGPTAVLSEEFTSTNFKILDPVINAAGGPEVSSDSFGSGQTFFTLSGGISTSDTYQVWSGFQFFFKVKVPANVVATPGDASVSLSWDAAETFLGIVVGSYAIGQATVSGGPYTFTDVGNVTSATASGLTNGTTYFFKIETRDTAGLNIGRSAQVSAIPVEVPADEVILGGGGVIQSVLESIQRTALQALPVAVECLPITDLNCDGEVGLQDFSILLFSLPRPIPNLADFNKDEIVDVVDFSILFADWTEQILVFVPERQPEFFVQEAREELAAVGEIIVPEAPPQITEEEEISRGTFFKAVVPFFSRIFEKIGDFFKKVF